MRWSVLLVWSFTGTLTGDCQHLTIETDNDYAIQIYSSTLVVSAYDGGVDERRGIGVIAPDDGHPCALTSATGVQCTCFHSLVSLVGDTVKANV